MHAPSAFSVYFVDPWFEKGYLYSYGGLRIDHAARDNVISLRINPRRIPLREKDLSSPLLLKRASSPKAQVLFGTLNSSANFLLDKSWRVNYLY
jgi:hypothetical protein